MSANSSMSNKRVTALEGDPQNCRQFWGRKSRQDPLITHQDFYGRVFLVTPDVLTPRPETEQLIDEVLSLAGKPFLPGVKPTPRQLPKHPIIYDVGTGSGCIAITLKLELPDAEIYAIDISKPALEVEKENSRRLNAPIYTIISHLLENVNSFSLPTPDIIVANLPYVDENWPWLDKESLKTDPDIALYADDRGLKLIKDLIKTANSKYLILEADPCQHQEIITFAKSHGYNLINTRGFILSFVRP